MRKNRFSAVTKFILEELQEKRTVFDLAEKVNLTLPSLRQTIGRLRKQELISVCDYKVTSIKKSHINYYKLTDKGMDFIKTVNDYLIIKQKKDELNKKIILFSNSEQQEKTKSFTEKLTKKAKNEELDKKKVQFSNDVALEKTKSFIKTLTKKATPWDALISNK